MPIVVQVPVSKPLPRALEGVAASQSDVVSLRQLEELGVTRWQARQRVRGGRWQEPLAGAFVLHSGPITPRQRLELALAWTQHRAVLSGPTAAELGGLKGYETREIHLLLPRDASHRTAVPGLVVQRSRRLTPDDAAGRPRRIRIARAVVQTAALRRCAEDAEAVLAAAVQQRVVTPEQLRRAVEASWQLRHKDVMRVALTDIGAGAESLPEIQFRRLCRDHGLPLPRLQTRHVLGGRRRRLDAEWTDYGVVAEIDGGSHLQYDRWVDDKARDNQIAISGRLVLRFPASKVRHQPEEVAADIRAALILRGWRP